MATMLHHKIGTGETRLGSVEERAERALEIAKRRMGPVEEQDEPVVKTSRTGVEPTRAGVDPASTGKEPLEERTTYDVLGAFSTLAKGIGVAATIATTLQRLMPHRARSGARFAGRESLWSAVGNLGAGVLAGAGAAVLLAPVSGAKMRAALAQHLQVSKQKAIWAIDRFASGLRTAHGATTNAELGNERESHRDAEAGAANKADGDPMPFIGSPSYSR